MKTFKQCIINFYINKVYVKKYLKKNNDIQIVKSFEDLDKLTKITNEEEND